MPGDEKSLAERWFEEQQAWQKTMRDYADAAVQDEEFLMHLGNAMRGSLLAGTPYPQQTPEAFNARTEPMPDALAEVLFTLKRIEGRLRDLEASVEALGVARAPKPPSARKSSTTAAAAPRRRTAPTTEGA